MRNKGMFTSGQNFLELKEEQVLLRIGAVMELKNPLTSVYQNLKKVFSNKRVRSLNSGNTSFSCRAKLIKLVYNKKRAFLAFFEHGCHLNRLWLSSLKAQIHGKYLQEHSLLRTSSFPFLHRYFSRILSSNAASKNLYKPQIPLCKTFKMLLQS